MNNEADPQLEPDAAAPTPPRPRVTRRRWNVSLVWLVPALAVVIGAVMVLRAWSSAGPRITISFQTAEGIEAGKTQVRYKNVVIGAVKSIRLSPDRARVLVTVDLTQNAEQFAHADTRFWVVRPRVAASGISGFDTLLSGAFIAADVGKSEQEQREFTGLETPPTVIYGAVGRRYTLRADDLGSLDIGSPVYYRRVQVGRVVGRQLTKDGRGVAVQVFIDAPNDRFVTRSTRFWNASGIDVSLGANGLKVDTQSIATLVAGGIAFQTPPGVWDNTPAPENAEYVLSEDQKTALTPPYGEPLFISLRFDQSLRGLATEAPVEFHGIEIGKVVAVNADFDPARQAFPVVVGVVIYPQRLGAAYDKLVEGAGDPGPEREAALIGRLVDHGLRAQARTGNLLTGQLYIALDFVPNARKVAFDRSAVPLEIPTVPGSFDKLQEQVARIVERIDNVPFDDIGRRLDASLAGVDEALKKVNGEVLPDVRATLKTAQDSTAAIGRTAAAAGGALADDAPLLQNLGQTLKELQRSAQSLRALTDYLGRHPEALLRGRPVGQEVLPPAAAPANPPAAGAAPPPAPAPAPAPTR